MLKLEVPKCKIFRLYLPTKRRLDANGCTRPSILQMDLLDDIKHVWLFWVIIKLKVRIFIKNFAPLAKMITVRALLTIAASKGWELHQMDVHNAFLHGDLHEDLYIKPPLGFHPPQPNLVCKLKKSLYGLRQAPRQWYFKLVSALLRYGFVQSPLDHSLFIYRRHNIFLALLMNVDDMVRTGNSHDHCCEFKSYLQHCFTLKDLGPLKYFLGIEVAPSYGIKS